MGIRQAGRWVLVVAMGFGSRAARADAWDPLDNGNGTKNQLVPGSEQTHNLIAQAGPTADEDWYQFLVDGYSSYEVVVDGMSADVTPISLALVDSAGTQVAGSGGVLSARSLTIENTTGGFDGTRFIRVRSGGCTTGCGSGTTYTIHAHDTTYAIPRFNNSASQVTIVVLRNNVNCAGSCSSGMLHFFNAAGVLLVQVPFSTGFFGSFVLNTATIPELQNQSGTISVTGHGAYGAFSGKAVSVEPTTGFTFDTPMVPRPQ